MVLAFEPTTFGTWVSSHNYYTRAPALSWNKFLNPFVIPLKNALTVYVTPLFDSFYNLLETSSVTRKNPQMYIKVAQKWFH